MNDDLDISKLGQVELKDRHHRVIALLIKGMSNKQIAAELGYSIRTIEGIKKDIREHYVAYNDVMLGYLLRQREESIIDN
jgi:DNA-binding NarL/FixJ family response regulator